MANTLGELIKLWRKEAGLSQLLLAKAIKKSEKAISHFETNRYPPGIETIEKIVIALNRGQADKLQAMAMRESKLAQTGLFKIAEKESNYNSHRNEMILIAQRQGLIPNPASENALEVIRSISGYEGAEFQNPKAAAKAYHEALNRPEVRLYDAFSRLTTEAQERYIKMMELEIKALDKS